MATPQSNIKLLANVDIKSDYKNSFTFDSIGEQTTFFTNKAINVRGNLSYVRKDEKKVIRYDGVVDDIYNISYLMFQNLDYSSKWFYAFVTDVKYINENVTNILFEIDVLQSWYFDLKYRDSYVEREHVANDTVWTHLVDENLNIGEPIVRTEENIPELEFRAIMIATTFYYDPPSFTDYRGHIVGGIYTGLASIPWHEENFLTLVFFFDNVELGGKTDGIQSIFYMPSYFVGEFIDGEALEFEEPITLTKSFPKNSNDIDGYIPKNNKLFNYPYNYLHVSNYNGMSKIYKYEFSDLIGMDFNVNSEIAPNPTLLLTPLSYKGDNLNYSESMSTQGYPICSFVNDVYKNWLAQNIVSAPLSVVGSGLALGVGIATLNPIAIAGGILGVANSIGAFYEKSVIPDQARGSNNGSINTALNNVNFRFQRTTITSEYAKIIDNYFDRFGYKVNELKTPILKTRINWNYLKLRESNIFGNLNNKDLEKVNSIFENGITFWHNDNVGNYNRTNPSI